MKKSLKALHAKKLSKWQKSIVKLTCLCIQEPISVMTVRALSPTTTMNIFLSEKIDL